MITDSEYLDTSRTNQPHNYFGLSMDEKPVAVNNGSLYIEMDTGKIYLYDAEGAEWLEWNRA